MLRKSVIKSAQGAVDYFRTELSRADYMTEKGQVVGQWNGKLAQELGLSGAVTDSAFAALSFNYHPERVSN